GCTTRTPARARAASPRCGRAARAVRRSSADRTRTTAARRPCAPPSVPGSVAVVVGLVRAFDRHAQVFRLLPGQPGQLHADLLQVQPGHFLVQVLWQAVDLLAVELLVGP